MQTYDFDTADGMISSKLVWQRSSHNEDVSIRKIAILLECELAEVQTTYISQVIAKMQAVGDTTTPQMTNALIMIMGMLAQEKAQQSAELTIHPDDTPSGVMHLWVSNLFQGMISGPF